MIKHIVVIPKGRGDSLLHRKFNSCFKLWIKLENALVSNRKDLMDQSEHHFCFIQFSGLQYHMKFRDCYGKSSLFQYQRCYGCCRGCSFVWNGLGTWEYFLGALKWRPYIKIDGKINFFIWRLSFFIKQARVNWNKTFEETTFFRHFFWC